MGGYSRNVATFLTGVLATEVDVCCAINQSGPVAMSA